MATPTVDASAHWRVLDFISDLHLQASAPATFAAFQAYVRNTPADALFILGDLFEVWVGDDVVGMASLANVTEGQTPGFEAWCQQLLAAAAQRMAVFFMHGNRDFLLGKTFVTASGMTLLADPTVLLWGQQRWLLSHGDALCLADTDYQRFRAEVRTPAWQAAFLAKPLAQRQALARSLRAQSQARKASGAVSADVDTAAALQWLQAAQANTLIHGHTHRPASHLLNPGGTTALRRLVLSDWDAAASPPRLEVLRLASNAAPARVKL